MSKSKTFSRFLPKLAASALCLFAASPIARAHAESANQPFHGAQITLSVGYGSGGGFDLYTRVLGRFLGKHIPGNPSVIVQNVVGAGSLTLANDLYHMAPKDGTSLGMVAQTLPVDQLLGSPGTHFDFSQFQIIGRLAESGTVVVVWRTSPVKTIKDAETISTPVAATGTSSEAFIVPVVLNNLVGTKFNVIGGYTGTEDMMLALQRHEADATTVIVSSMTSQFAPFLKAGDVHAIVQNALTRNAFFPDVPTTVELARNTDDQEILKLFALGGDIGRSIIAPPGVPPERIKILRNAFMATMNDKDFISAAKQAGLDLEPMDGAALQKIVDDLKSISPSVIARAKLARTLHR